MLLVNIPVMTATVNGESTGYGDRNGTIADKYSIDNENKKLLSI